jgi:photosystem II stability/assembly factor-like uncharacterized protein
MQKLLICSILFILICSSEINAQNSFWKNTNGPQNFYISCIGTDSSERVALIVNFKDLYYINPDGTLKLINSNFTNASIYSILLYDKNTIFVGTWGGGVYRSTDAGTSWAQLTNSMIQGYSDKLKIDNKGIIYSLGSGIIKSSDQGKTWTRCQYIQDMYTFNSFISCENGEIYVSAESPNPPNGGVFKSTDSGDSWIEVLRDRKSYGSLALAKNGNIFLWKDTTIFCTKDNAKTWEIINSPIQKTTDICSGKGGEVFIRYGNYLHPGILRSTDSGNSWEEISKNFNSAIDFGSLDFRIEDVTSNIKGEIFIISSTRGLYKSSNNGNSWIRLYKGESLAPLKIFDMVSTDWAVFTLGYNNNVQMDLFGKKGEDGEWVEIGDMDPTVYTALSRDVEGNIYKSTATNSYRALIIKTSKITTHYDSMVTIPTKANISGMAIDSKGEIIAITSGDGIYKTIDDKSAVIKANNNLQDLYVNSIIIDQNKEVVIGTKSKGLFRSIDNCSTWIQENNGLAELNITSLCVDKKNTAYIGTQNGNIYRMTNRSALCKPKFHSPNPILKISCNSQGVVFALTSTKLYTSVDEGETWGLVEDLVVSNQLTSICIDSLDYLYVGTNDKGVFRTINTTKILAPAAPTLISVLNGAQTLNSNISLSWTAVKFSNIYYLQVASDSLFSNIVQEDSIYNATNKTLNLSQIKTKLYWRVRALNIVGIGPWSSTWSFSTFTKLSAPVLSYPANNSKGQPLDIKLNWDSVQDAETYRILIAQDSMFVNPIIDDSLLTSASKSISGLKSGMQYYWKVRAKNNLSYSNYSQIWRFITILPACEKLSAQVGNLAVNLSWVDKSENETGFMIERKTEKEPAFTLRTMLPENKTMYTDSTLPNTTYIYRVKAYNKYTESEYSNELTVTTITLSVEKYKGLPTEYSLLQNYPNPFNPSTVISYSLLSESKVRVVVYNSLGQLVNELVNRTQPGGYYEEVFDAGCLPSGIYLYSILAQPLVGGNSFTSVKKMLLVK